ncbi:protein-glutamate O-methyltransferase CheR [Stakelama sp. CBK3Z-3]|uniref:Chemotaxis protein methyltransferase n=1 Tax=Stakelama flava TaxID=2860338 RepID=A0ABS6XJP9_9SPHN|nr:protein-glutamate O-methyltransferase CheR [Stakelama flava]MBW4330429.1 protein-glutamate O-methyltransferase CheR [Stakelama flava]
MASLAPDSNGTALSDGAPALGDADFARVARIMQSDARIHLTEVKKTLVHSRLSRRLRKHGLAGFKAYLDMVEADADERREMVTALTTNHTHFFREDHHFDHLREELLPRLKADTSRTPVRIWSSACSSGEEVYTIAMCLLGTDRSHAQWMNGRDVKLLATDLSEPVVNATREALYSESTVAPVPDAYRNLWMQQEDGGYRMAPAVRALVTARVLNLFHQWPMRMRYDAIFCRNVMIYFDDDAKAELEAKLVDMLKPDGFLYIGHSERLIGPAAEKMTPCGNTIYRLAGAH